MKRATLSDLTTAPYDVLVIGGGIYGAMTARDAALRGLRTALVDRGDFGAGSSHNSLKLMHGGIRYVQHLDLTRLRASARERAFWQFAAPDLVRPLEFVIPLTGYGIKGPEAFAAAALLYNTASAGLRGPHYPAARVLGRSDAARRLGDLAPEGLRGGGLWRDGQIQDANRLQLAVLKAAFEAGADLANYIGADSLLGDRARVTGARLHDRLTGAEGTVTARVVLCCGGAATEDLAAPVLPAGARNRFPGFARATNIVVDRPGRECGLGVVSRSRSDAVVDRGGRMYFLTPWQGCLIVGTHEATNGADCTAAAADIDDFLEELSHASPSLGLGRKDILHVYQGLIPADVDDSRGDVRRQTKGTLIDHAAADEVPGLISVIGAKYTTARLIAERAVDLAMAQMDHGQPRPSASLTTPLPTIGLAPCDPDDPANLTARVRAAVRDEMAQNLSDLVLRRTDLVETGRLGGARLQAAATAMALEMGWDDARKQQEMAAVRQILGLD